MSFCTIEMFPASYGDCFLVRCHNKEKTNILIDTGFASTYRNFLKKRLLELSQVGESLSLLVFTHIDEDHLGGGLKLLEENGAAASPNIIKIERIWHNSYRHLQFEKKEDVVSDKIDQEIVNALCAKGYPQEIHSDLADVRESAGAKAGSSLAASILQGGYSWNVDFQGQAVYTEKPVKIQLNDDVSLTLLSPNIGKLKELEKYWKDELYNLGFRGKYTYDKIFDDAFEFLLLRTEDLSGVDIRERASSSQISLDKVLKADNIEELLPNFSPDTSVKNGSSISFILEFDDKKMLFLGDSDPLCIETQLKELSSCNSSIYFDVVKVSHHGSKNNTFPAHLSMIDAHKYLISTNGVKYNHPDLDTLLRIVSRVNEKEKRLIFNYSTEPGRFLNNSTLKDKYHYDVEMPSHVGIIQIEL